MCKISAKEKNKAGKGVRSLNRVTFEPTHGGEGGRYLAIVEGTASAKIKVRKWGVEPEDQ